MLERTDNGVLNSWHKLKQMQSEEISESFAPTMSLSTASRPKQKLSLSNLKSGFSIQAQKQQAQQKEHDTKFMNTTRLSDISSDKGSQAS
jgi:hypothetical protein